MPRPTTHRRQIVAGLVAESDGTLRFAVAICEPNFSWYLIGVGYRSFHLFTVYPTWYQNARRECAGSGIQGTESGIIEGREEPLQKGSTMARKALNYPQFNWRVNPDVIAKLKAEADETDHAVSDLIDTAVKFWWEHREDSSNANH